MYKRPFDTHRQASEIVTIEANLEIIVSRDPILVCPMGRIHVSMPRSKRDVHIASAAHADKSGGAENARAKPRRHE